MRGKGASREPCQKPVTGQQRRRRRQLCLGGSGILTVGTKPARGDTGNSDPGDDGDGSDNKKRSNRILNGERAHHGAPPALLEITFTFKKCFYIQLQLRS